MSPEQKLVIVIVLITTILIIYFIYTNFVIPDAEFASLLGDVNTLIDTDTKINKQLSSVAGINKSEISAGNYKININNNTLYITDPNQKYLWGRP